MHGTLEWCIFHATKKRGWRQLSWHHACKCEVIVELYQKYTTWCVSWSLIKRCHYHACILQVILSSQVRSKLHKFIRSCTRVQLPKGSTNLFSARVQLASSKTNLFTPCVQLASDLINLSSYSRVTCMQMYILMICSRATREWHEKFVHKVACYTCVNAKFKLSCTVRLLLANLFTTYENPLIKCTIMGLMVHLEKLA